MMNVYFILLIFGYLIKTSHIIEYLVICSVLKFYATSLSKHPKSQQQYLNKLTLIIPPTCITVHSEKSG